MLSGRVHLLLPVLVATVSTVVSGLVFSDISAVHLILGWLIQVAASVLMLGWRRSWAPMVVLVGATAVIAFAPIDWQQAFASGLTVWVPSMASYAMARLVSDVRSRVEVAVGAVALVCWVAIMVSPAPVTLLGLLAAAAPPLCGACAALVVRLRKARRDRIAWQARERALEADRRAATEREQIAADLHDLVTHQMVRIVFQARNLADHTVDRRTSTAADEIAGTATMALTQMRDFLRTTRSTEPETTDETGTTAAALAGQIDSIVHDERDLGRSVTARTANAGDDVRLSAAAAGCVLRGIHEGVVNAAKHAPEAAVLITSSIEREEYAAVVENALPTGAPQELAATGSGTGLRGLARRAELVGGNATVSCSDDRFRLEIRVPLLDRSAPQAQAQPRR